MHLDLNWFGSTREQNRLVLFSKSKKKKIKLKPTDLLLKFLSMKNYLTN